MPATLPECPPHQDHAAVAAFYAEHGFYHARGVLGPADVAPLERDFDRIVDQLVRSGEVINANWRRPTMAAIDPDTENTEIIHTHQVQKYSAAWARILFDDRLLDLAEALIGPDIVMHHTKLFLKPAGRGSPFPAHQDHGYFPTVANSMLAVNIAVTRHDESNGCVRVWPGSHKVGPQPNSMGSHEEFSARFPWSESVPVICEPGDLLFFSYLTVHGSGSNRGQHPRKHVLVQLLSGKDRLEREGHICSNLVLRGFNHHMTRNGANRH